MSWRIEPWPRSTGIQEGMAAKIHDPLWLLARQWQVGEFAAKDAGTPSLVAFNGSATAITAWRGSQQTTWTPLDSASAPLDVLIEPESETAPGARERIEAGAYFLRLLGDAGLSRYDAAFTAACPISALVLTDAAFTADPLFRSLAQRCPDGAALQSIATALAASQATPVAISAADVPAVTNVATAWLTWYGAEIAPSAGTGAAATWQMHRMEYGFSVASAAAGGSVLTSNSYLGDGLDWYDFDIDPSAIAPAAAATTPIARRGVPAPVRYGGMPLPRFWAMEDALSDLGAIDAAGTDIGRLLLVEFATMYSNDWFVAPVKVPVGTLTILDSVLVTDVFGQNFVLGRAGDNDPQWNLFSLSSLSPSNAAAHPAQRALYLPPTADAVAESEPVESVLFLRDVVADLAWGVETRVEDALGRKVDRRARWTSGGIPRTGDPNKPAYRVETIVPDFWIPLAPETAPTASGQQSIRLRMVPLEVDRAGSPMAVEPAGVVLAQSDGDGHLWLFDEEVPREGTAVDRIYRYARWHSGRTSLWSARRRGTGRGEGSSGLRFDTVDPT
ncbi:MAG: hypothetical protein NVSMB64_05680 [Candidatus Velthaea sp.]